MAITGDVALFMWAGFVFLVIFGIICQIILEILHEKRQLELAKRPYNHQTINEPIHLDNVPNTHHNTGFWLAFNEP